MTKTRPSLFYPGSCLVLIRFGLLLASSLTLKDVKSPGQYGFSEWREC